ncbi:hypothetical protein EVA_03325 [gut metagenome]|uniref:Uncharacterized protein n=1 Tax=gut metagenome TaxID=749906 RepID=J9GL47_9ZZZZ
MKNIEDEVAFHVMVTVYGSVRIAVTSSLVKKHLNFVRCAIIRRVTSNCIKRIIKFCVLFKKRFLAYSKHIRIFGWARNRFCILVYLSGVLKSRKAEWGLS